MSAQNVWKHFYRQIIDGMIVPAYIPDQRNDMLRYRREAALERKLEAANRRIDELSQKCAEYDQAWQAAERRLSENNRSIVISDNDARLLEQWHERA